MGYEALIPFLAYFAAMWLVLKFNASALLGAIIAVIVPFIVGFVITLIKFGTSLQTVQDFFTIASIGKLIVTFFISLYIFKKIRESDDVMAMVLWSVGGIILILVIIPYLFRTF